MASSELTTFQYGHFGVVPMIAQPGEYNNGAVDWVGKTPAETFDAVDQIGIKPALIVNHPRSGIGGYFASVRLEPDGSALDQNLWSPNFDAIEVFNDATFDSSRDIVDDWVALLKSGKRVSAVGNSDSHHLRSSPVGYPRTCFPFGHDDPSKLTYRHHQRRPLHDRRGPWRRWSRCRSNSRQAKLRGDRAIAQLGTSQRDRGVCRRRAGQDRAGQQQRHGHACLSPWPGTPIRAQGSPPG